jgi:hypothetical protein
MHLLSMAMMTRYVGQCCRVVLTSATCAIRLPAKVWCVADAGGGYSGYG